MAINYGISLSLQQCNEEGGRAKINLSHVSCKNFVAEALSPQYYLNFSTLGE
jgi:hypothetical protein